MRCRNIIETGNSSTPSNIPGRVTPSNIPGGVTPSNIPGGGNYTLKEISNEVCKDIEKKIVAELKVTITNTTKLTVDKLVDDLTVYRNFIDVFTTFDTYKKTDNSITTEAIYSYDLLNRFGTYDGVGVFTSEPLDSIIEIEMYEMYLPDYGGYTYHTTTTNPPLVNNTIGPPVFTRTPYGIISIEYKELIHVLSAISTRHGNHFLFRAVVEGNRLRLIPLFNRITLRSPQLIDKTATFTFSDGVSNLAMNEDVYRGVYVYAVNITAAPWATDQYLAIGLPTTTLNINDRVLISDFNSDVQDLTSYVTNVGGLYISPDYRVGMSYVVLTNPGISISRPYTSLVVDAQTLGPLGGTYTNGDNGVGAEISITTGIPDFSSTNILFGTTILVKDEIDARRNGIYEVTDLVPTSTPSTMKLTRSTTADTNTKLRFGSIITVTTPGRIYSLNYEKPDVIITFGRSNLRFMEMSVNLPAPIRGILSAPVTVTVVNRSFIIPVRYRKNIKTTTNHIILT